MLYYFEWFSYIWKSLFILFSGYFIFFSFPRVIGFLCVSDFSILHQGRHFKSNLLVPYVGIIEWFLWMVNIQDLRALVAVRSTPPNEDTSGTSSKYAEGRGKFVFWAWFIAIEFISSLPGLILWSFFFYHVFVYSFCRFYLWELNLKHTFLVPPFAGTFIIQVPYFRSKLQDIISLSRAFKELFKEILRSVVIWRCCLHWYMLYSSKWYFPNDQVTSSVGCMIQFFEDEIGRFLRMKFINTSLLLLASSAPSMITKIFIPICSSCPWALFMYKTCPPLKGLVHKARMGCHWCWHFQLQQLHACLELQPHSCGSFIWITASHFGFSGTLREDVLELRAAIKLESSQRNIPSYPTGMGG